MIIEDEKATSLGKSIYILYPRMYLALSIVQKFGIFRITCKVCSKCEGFGLAMHVHAISHRFLYSDLKTKPSNGHKNFTILIRIKLKYQYFRAKFIYTFENYICNVNSECSLIQNPFPVVTSIHFKICIGLPIQCIQHYIYAQKTSFVHLLLAVFFNCIKLKFYLYLRIYFVLKSYKVDNL